MRNHFDKKTNRHKVLAVFFMLAIFSVKLKAAEEPREVTKKGNDLVTMSVGTVISNADPVFTGGGWSGQTAIGVQNIVIFQIDFNNTANLYFQNLTFTATCLVDINCYGNPASPTTITQSFNNVSLQINYNPASGVTYKGIADYKFNGAYKVDVIYKGITAPALSPLGNYPIFSLTNKMIINRQYNFIDNSTDITKYYTDGNKLNVSWTPTNYPGAESFDLEWTYVDITSQAGALIKFFKLFGYTTINQSFLENIFRNNSSRVNVAGSQYQFNLNYNQGFILYRIRGVQFRNSDGLRLEGNWNYTADAMPGSIYNQFDQGIVDVDWHEENLNWQYNAVYAEDGKKKEVISYFDGSLRSRQTVTINNEDNVSVVAEPVYDVFGRSAMSILPAPFYNENRLKYFKSFNVNNSLKPVSYKDIPVTSCTIVASPLNPASGVERYYSSSNEFMANNNEPWHKAIPKSEGFPFAVTLYTPDNTGRIRAQGGVGADFQIGSNHETKYYYGKPSQYELDRVFGAEAGDHTHYLKNMVQDANGQVSVSYQNSEGKTVATALAGLPPANVEALSSSAEPTTIVKDILLTPSSFQINAARSSLEATNTFLVASTGNYKFTYKFVPEQYTETFSGGTLCYTCSYDLLITLKDDCGTTELHKVDIKNITPFNTSCTTPTEISNFFNVTLNKIGEYTVYFELVVNKETLDAYTDHYLVTNTDIKKLNYFLLEQLIEENLAECYNNCEACKALPATQAAFIDQVKAYYIKEGLTFGTAETNYAIQLYSTIQTNCALLGQQCLQSPCQEILEVIKEDVTPGGQYAEYDNDYNLIDPEINVLSHYQNPPLPYSPATIEDDNGNIVPVTQLTLKEFIESFQESWAESLAPLHPEYCYYTWCGMNTSSQAFNQKLEYMNDPTEAMTPPAILFDRTNPLKLITVDPFFQSGAYGFPYRAQMEADMNAYSVNVLNLTGQTTKNILKVIDFLLYCGNQTPAISWDNCSIPVNAVCRSDYKEWLLYKEWYLDRKLKYYTLAMKAQFQTCNNCYIPSSGGDPGSSVNCIPPLLSDFSIQQVPNSSADGIKRIILKYKGGNDIVSWPILVTVEMSGSLPTITQGIIFTPGFGSQEMMVQEEYTNFKIITVACAELSGRIGLPGKKSVNPKNVLSSIESLKNNSKKEVTATTAKNEKPGGIFPCPSASDFTITYFGMGSCQVNVCYTGAAIPAGCSVTVNVRISYQSQFGGPQVFNFTPTFWGGQTTCQSAIVPNCNNILDAFIIDVSCSCGWICPDQGDFNFDMVYNGLGGDLMLCYNGAAIPPGKIIRVTSLVRTTCDTLSYTTDFCSSKSNCQVVRHFGDRTPCVYDFATIQSIVCLDGSCDSSACPGVEKFLINYYTGEVCYNGPPFTGSATICIEYIDECEQTRFDCVTVSSSNPCAFFPNFNSKCPIKNISNTTVVCNGWQCPSGSGSFNTTQQYNTSTSTWDITTCYTGPAIPANKTIHVNITAYNKQCSPGNPEVQYTATFCQSNPCFTYKINMPIRCDLEWEITYGNISCTDEPCGGSGGECPDSSAFTVNQVIPNGCTPMPGFQGVTIRVTHTGGPLTINAPVERVKVTVKISTHNSITGKKFTHYKYVWFTNGDTYKDICYYFIANRVIDSIKTVSTECKGACPAGDCCDDPRYSLYEGKVRRFQDYIEPDFAAVQNSYYNHTGNETAYPLNTCKNDCEMMADGWMQDLQNCFSPTDPQRFEKAERLRRQLIDVCKQSCQAQQGNTIIHPYSDVNPSPSFESVIIAAFNGITPTCAYDLISDPYPWGKSPILEKTYATETDAQICNRLQQLINEAQAHSYATTVAGVHQYLKDYYSPYYDLEDDELQLVFTSCQTCGNGVMRLPVELPPFMNGNYKACLPCTVYEQKKAAFLAKYPGITPAHDKYEVLFRNYMNHQTGFSHAFANYYEFEQQCTANANNFRNYGKICELPVSMEMDINLVSQCLDEKFYNALSNATVIYTRYIEEVKRIYRNNYTAKCLSAKPRLESEAKLYEYHYTLYYYDQSSNLVKTVPPKGVAYLTDVEINTLWTNRNQFIVPAHILATTYQYNSFNQVVKQYSPDGGTSEFWYDRLGRLVVSQNEEQKTPVNGGAANRFSYTKYEQTLGRITEVGEKSNPYDDIRNIDVRNNTTLTNWLNSGTDIQITSTIYDRPDLNPNTTIAAEQQFYTSRKRVIATIFKKIRYANPSQYDAATHYSYDISGNAKSVWQENTRLKEADASTQGIKRIDYEFDLIAGKVNKVWYQKGKGDQYIYTYKYDAENRVTAAQTSRDGLVWQEDSRYKYYLHGSLARTELGSLRVQGTDYAYTLQGWMKHINAPSLNEKGDIGHDGDPTLASNVFAGVARDVLGYSISYFNNDYKPIGISSPLNFTETIPNAMGTGKNLYNGNIRATTLQVAQLGTGKTYSYSYDQLNRIVKMRKHETTYSPTATPSLTIANSTIEYQEDITYDSNGNIMSYLRNGTTVQPAMDNLTYNYVANKNQLEYVDDGVTATNYTEDIDDQAAGNYLYDKIGNLRKDVKENISQIEWTVYGKIKKITKTGTSSAVIEYEYDAGGNRIFKKVTTSGGSIEEIKYTFYVRDANGNTIAIYTRQDNAVVKWSEQHLYGSSRLGMENLNITVPATVSLPAPGASMADGFDYGKRIYELSNHLGNVLSTISDKKVQVQNGSTGTILYYMTEVITATDYYPFGMAMPGRKYEATTSYRYGFNGKEKDKEISMEDYDFGARIYDTRVARWLSVDPLFKKYVPFSPYVFSINNPIYFIDLDGNVVIGPDGKKIEVSEKDGKLIFSKNADKATTVAITALYYTSKGKALFEKLQANSRNFMFMDYDKELKAAMNNPNDGEMGFASSKVAVETSLEVYRINQEVDLAYANKNSTVEELSAANDKLKAVLEKFKEVVKKEAVWDENKGVSKNENNSTMYLVVDFALFYSAENDKDQLADIQITTTNPKELLKSFIGGELISTIAEEAIHGLQTESNIYKPVGNKPPYKQGKSIEYEKRKHENDAKKEIREGIYKQYIEKKVKEDKKNKSS